jgi:hypothetical protein
MQISFTTIGCNNTPHWTATPLLRKHEPITEVKLIFSIIGNATLNLKKNMLHITSNIQPKYYMATLSYTYRENSN